MKVFISENDTFNYTLYNETEAEETFYFTVEYTPEMFVDLPDDIVKKYKKVYKEFWEMNNIIENLLKGNKNEK